jgi:hypothetical protein
VSRLAAGSWQYLPGGAGAAFEVFCAVLLPAALVTEVAKFAGGMQARFSPWEVGEGAGLPVCSSPWVRVAGHECVHAGQECVSALANIVMLHAHDTREGTALAHAKRNPSPPHLARPPCAQGGETGTGGRF